MIPFADVALSAPSQEAVGVAVNVFFYFMGGLGGAAICLNQGKQFFAGKGKAEDQFATVGQLQALEARLSGPMQRIWHIDKIIALLAEKAGIDPRKYNVKLYPQTVIFSMLALVAGVWLAHQVEKLPKLSMDAPAFTFELPQEAASDTPLNDSEKRFWDRNTGRVRSIFSGQWHELGSSVTEEVKQLEFDSEGNVIQGKVKANAEGKQGFTALAIGSLVAFIVKKIIQAIMWAMIIHEVREHWQLFAIITALWILVPFFMAMLGARIGRAGK